MTPTKNDHNAADFLSSIDLLINAAEEAEGGLSAMTTLDDGETLATGIVSETSDIPDLPSHFDGWPTRHKSKKPNPRDPLLDREWKWWDAYDDAFAAAKKGALIVIYGGHGGGKTQMAMEIARNLPTRFLPAKKSGAFTLAPVARPLIYRKAMEFFNDLRACYHPKSSMTEKDVISRYATAALVVIDEAHERGEKAFEDRQLTLMIDKRYDEMLPTILITNLDRQSYYATLSTAAQSRMVETAVGIDANWGTFRTRKPNEKKNL